MTTQNIGLFKGLIAKMDYLDLRQKTIAQNIANADTPNYRPSDVTDVDFSQVLNRVSAPQGSVHLAATRPGHMPAPGSVAQAKSDEQKVSYEVAPAENAVVMEEQLIKAARTTMDYNLMTNIYQKQVGMIRTAIGRS